MIPEKLCNRRTVQDTYMDPPGKGKRQNLLRKLGWGGQERVEREGDGATEKKINLTTKS